MRVDAIVRGRIMRRHFSRATRCTVLSLFLAVTSTFLLVGCGGGGKDSTPTAPPTVLTTISVSLNSATLQTGQSGQASAAGLDQNGAAIATGTLTWSSSSPAVATVSASGAVSALTAGQTQIIASAGGRSGQATLTVIPVPVATVNVTPLAPSIVVGATQQLTAVTLDAGNAVLTGRTVTWASSDTAKATVTGGGLVTGISAGSATVTATSEGRSGTATITVLPVPVATVTVTPATTSLAVGATQQLSAITRDAAGITLTGRTVAWTSADQTKVTVSASGLVTAVALGTSAITATSEGKQGTAQVTVTAASGLSISTITPTVLIEGASATITGTGFAAGASVLVAGLSAPVQSVSATQLQVTVPVRDCQPQRSEPVIVTVGGASVQSSATVKGTDPSVLNTGFFMWSGSTQCIQLTAAPAGAKYVIGMLSTSAAPAEVTAAQLFATAGTSSALAALSLPGTQASRIASAPIAGWFTPRTAGAAARVPGEVPTRVTRRDVGAEARIRDSEARFKTESTRTAARQWLSASQAARHLRGSTQALTVGDTTTQFVQSATVSCTTAPSVRAVVRYIGTDNIWLEDVANPTVAFTTAEYQAMETFYSTTTKPVLASYVGPFTDVDNNQRNLILITKEVNKQPNILGFVWGTDLVPRSLCATSNVAEIFFGVAPDPAGVYGHVYTKTDVANDYRSLMAHELTHVIQSGQYYYGPAGRKATWEMEGGATLSEQLVGFRVYGYASGQDLGRTQYRADTEWFQNWVVDLAFYYGFISSSARTIGAPEQCTWIGRPSEGNAGPCGNSGRMVYGVPATLLRFVLDKYGPSYSGGEAALARNIASSASVGYASLTVPAGVTTSELLTRFGLMMWSDGRTANPLTSWNLADIWSGFVATAQLTPYTSTDQLPTVQASVRAGSTAFLEWSPGVATSPMSLRIRTASGGAVPSTMVLWIYRYQ